MEVMAIRRIYPNHVLQPTVLDGDIHEMNHVRSTQEMTVRDILNLKYD